MSPWLAVFNHIILETNDFTPKKFFPSFFLFIYFVIVAVCLFLLFIILQCTFGQIYEL